MYIEAGTQSAHMSQILCMKVSIKFNLRDSIKMVGAYILVGLCP